MSIQSQVSNQEASTCNAVMEPLELSAGSFGLNGTACPRSKEPRCASDCVSDRMQIRMKLDQTSAQAALMRPKV